MIILQTIALLIVATALVGLALSVLVLVAAYKLFEKAGVEGWKAIVPFYNLYVLTVDIAKLDVIWFALLFAAFIPIIGWLIAIVASLNISYATVRRFIKDKDMHIVGTILFGIFVVIIAFGNYSYDSSSYSKNGFFSDELIDQFKNGFEDSNSKSTGKSSSKTTKGHFCKNCGNKLGAKDKFCQNCGNKVD